MLHFVPMQLSPSQKIFKLSLHLTLINFAIDLTIDLADSLSALHL